MIVFDLICKENGHQFEGWFGSSKEYEEQRQKGLIPCPSCGCDVVEKAMMAPNVAAKGNQAKEKPAKPASEELTAPVEASVPAAPDEAQTVSNAVSVPSEYKELMGKLAKAQAKALESSEWVGDDFADEARAIHYGETDEKLIHGIASAEDAEELEEEGIDITALPLPVTPPKSQN